MSCLPRSARCRFVLLVLVLGELASSLRADFFAFKDGFVIEGKTRQETERIWMGPKEGILDIPRGFYFIDDGARRIIFKASEVRQLEKAPAPPEEVFRAPDLQQIRPGRMFPILEVVKTTPWDRKWDRQITLRSETQEVTLPQRLRLLTPYRAEVVSRQHYLWGSCYLTREMGRGEVQGLLDNAPKETGLQEKPDMKAEVKANLRFHKINFYTQIGWYDLAEKELDRLVKDLPEFKSRVEDSRAALASRRAGDEFETIKRLHHAGQDEAVRKRLANFPRKEAAPKVQADVQDLESQINAQRICITETRRLLDHMQEKLGGPHSKELARAVSYIRGSLHAENVNRLENFLAQARQFEHQVNANRKPTTNPDQVLSLAVSGWLLGNNAADTHPEYAVALWQAGEMVQDYLRADRAGQRERVLQTYQSKNRNAVGLDEVLRLIPSLPPVEPDDKPSENVQERSVSRGGRSVKYTLQLPPEYRVTRSYPVLLVLHEAGEKPRDQLERWRKAAAENGYILAAPEWEVGPGQGYGYSEAEHAVVLDTLRDLRRRFAVDSDRIFLFGLGQGGKMAWDVGLSHPSEFAGVLPMAATPELFAFHYWRNGQYLPFYVVHGSQGDGQRSFEKLKDLFTYWTQRGGTAFPSLWVDYRGRGVEWFGGEVDNIFDWMRNKRRVFPLHEAGRYTGDLDTKLTTLRPGDNRFYWLSVSGLSPGRTRAVASFYSGPINPATLAGRIDPAARSKSNIIYIQAEGVRQVTIWLGRDSKGAGSINFDKPVTIYLNNRPQGAPRKVTPSLATLLEDLRERGDRQQMFLARITLP